MEKLLISVLLGVLIVASGCAAAKGTRTSSSAAPGPSGLVGEWRYLDCTYKNTSVDGTLEFRKDGRIVFDGRVDRDYPTEAEVIEVEASWSDGEIRIHDRPSSMPVPGFYVIEGRYLYLSEVPITASQDGGQPTWNYKLERLG